MRMEDLLMAVELCEEQMGWPGLSVVAADVPTYGDLLSQSTVPQKVFRASTAERVRAAGFELQQTLKAPHHTIWLPQGDRATWLGILERAFDPPRERRDL